jgi:hypothetical protein
MSHTRLYPFLAFKYWSNQLARLWQFTGVDDIESIHNHEDDPINKFGIRASIVGEEASQAFVLYHLDL